MRRHARREGRGQLVAALQMRMSLAVRQLDAELERFARRFVSDLPDTHRSLVPRWKPSLKLVEGMWRGCTDEEFREWGPLEKQLEVNRAHAEALLALDRAGESPIEDEAEKELLAWRAIGIISSQEDDIYREVATCHELEPNYMTSNPGRLVEGVAVIERTFGRHVALGYAFLLMAGLRTTEDLAKYGRRLQELYDRITSRSPLAGRIADAAEAGIAHLTNEERSKMVRSLRDQLWQDCSNRPGVPFLLTQVVDGHLGLRPGGVGDSLGLVVLDSIVVGKLAFPVRYFVREGHFYLEVRLSRGALEYWDPLTRRGRVQVASLRPVGVADLLVEGYRRLAHGYVSRNDHANAGRVANWVLEMRPEDPEALQILGASLLGRQDPRGAIKASAEALKHDCRLVDAHMVMGNAYSMMRRWSEAIDCYLRAIDLRRGYAEAYNNLGLALLSNGEPERALGAYREAIRSNPGYVEAHYNVGNLYLESGRYDKAIEAYRLATRHGPKFAGAYYNMGQAYYRKGQLHEALTAYQKAVEANPKHAGAWNNIGIVYRDLGEPERAVEAIERAVKLNPTLLR